MGKPLSDLNLGDSGPSSRDDLAIARREAQRFVEQLQAMENDETYGFAWGLIFDMRLTVQKTERVSAAQREAIHNIQVGAQRHQDQKENWKRHEQRAGRRYEGFDGRNK